MTDQVSDVTYDDRSDKEEVSAATDESEEDSELDSDLDDDEKENNNKEKKSSESGAQMEKFIFDDERNKKNNRLTKFEYARLIGLRADQIENNNPPPHEITKNSPDAAKMTFSMDIAKYELDHTEIPFPVVLLRRINVGAFPIIYEVWDVRELQLPFDVLKELELGIKPYYVDPFNFKNDI